MRERLNKNKISICMLLLIVGVISVPLLTDYVLAGTNLQASLSRIEAIKEGMGKIFPLRVAPMQTLDYGYGGAQFEADLFLLIPALLRLVGFGVDVSYKLFLFLIHVATAVIAYICFTKVFGRREIGLMGSLLYTWCPYRCSDIYINANVGEAVAWTFFPILLLGLVQLYTISQERRQSENAWVTLTLGLSLLACSSATFFLVAVGALVLTCLFMGHRTMSREVGICVGKAILVTGLLNAWFLIPMLLRMREPSVVGTLIYPNFRMRGMYLVQYLRVFSAAGDKLDFTENGMSNGQAMGVGVATILLVLLYLWCLFVKKFSDRIGVKVLCLTLGFMLLSSNVFPWDLLQNENMLFSIVLALLQSPAKWGIAACVGLIWIACRMLQKLSECGDERIYKGILVLTAAVSLGITQFMTGNILQTRGVVRTDTGEDWGRIPMQILMQESAFWRVCEAVSVVTLCILLAMWIIRRRKGVKRV